MNIIFLNDTQRKRIVSLVKPDQNDFLSYQNLDLLTAVTDSEGKFVLTMVHYLSSCIKRTDDNSNDYRYVLLSDDGDFFVSAKEQRGKLEDVFSPLPRVLSHEALLKMVQFYAECSSRRRQMQKDYLSTIDIGGLSYTEWYLRKGYKDVTPSRGFVAMLRGMAKRLWLLATFRRPTKSNGNCECKSLGEEMAELEELRRLGKISEEEYLTRKKRLEFLDHFHSRPIIS